MDSGYLEPGERLEDEYDVMRQLLPEEVIGIMDQLLCHEVGPIALSVLRLADIGRADGMARRTPPFADAFHIHLYRSFAVAGAKRIGAG